MRRVRAALPFDGITFHLLVADEGSCPLLRFKHASNFEFTISPDDRVRINRQIDRQLTNGGKLIASGESRRSNAANHLVDDLAVDRDAAVQVQAELKRLSWSRCRAHGIYSVLVI